MAAKNQIGGQSLAVSCREYSRLGAGAGMAVSRIAFTRVTSGMDENRDRYLGDFSGFSPPCPNHTKQGVAPAELDMANRLSHRRGTLNSVYCATAQPLQRRSPRESPSRRSLTTANPPAAVESGDGQVSDPARVEGHHILRTPCHVRIAAICAIIEMSIGKAAYFTGAAALILGLQAIYSVVTKINDWTDARRAKRPPDAP